MSKKLLLTAGRRRLTEHQFPTQYSKRCTGQTWPAAAQTEWRGRTMQRRKEGLEASSFLFHIYNQWPYHPSIYLHIYKNIDTEKKSDNPMMEQVWLVIGTLVPCCGSWGGHGHIHRTLHRVHRWNVITRWHSVLFEHVHTTQHKDSQGTVPDESKPKRLDDEMHWCHPR